MDWGITDKLVCSVVSTDTSWSSKLSPSMLYVLKCLFGAKEKSGVLCSTPSVAVSGCHRSHARRREVFEASFSTSLWFPSQRHPAYYGSQGYQHIPVGAGIQVGIHLVSDCSTWAGGLPDISRHQECLSTHYDFPASPTVSAVCHGGPSLPVVALLLYLGYIGHTEYRDRHFSCGGNTLECACPGLGPDILNILSGPRLASGRIVAFLQLDMETSLALSTIKGQMLSRAILLQRPIASHSLVKALWRVWHGFGPFWLHGTLIWCCLFYRSLLLNPSKIFVTNLFFGVANTLAQRISCKETIPNPSLR